MLDGFAVDSARPGARLQRFTPPREPVAAVRPPAACRGTPRNSVSPIRRTRPGRKHDGTLHAIRRARMPRMDRRGAGDDSPAAGGAALGRL